METHPHFFIWRPQRDAAVRLLEAHRKEAVRLGLDPSRVVLLRDPWRGGWVVLIPRDQMLRSIGEIF